MFTRKEAKMIAEELHKLIKGDVVDAAKDITKIETEEYLTPKDVSRILGWSPWTVRKKKDDLKCYVWVGGRIFFVKSQLHKMIQSGAVKLKSGIHV